MTATTRSRAVGRLHSPNASPKLPHPAGPTPKELDTAGGFILLTSLLDSLSSAAMSPQQPESAGREPPCRSVPAARRRSQPCSLGQRAARTDAQADRIRSRRRGMLADAR